MAISRPRRHKVGAPSKQDTKVSPPLRVLHVTWQIDASLGGAPAAAIHMARAEAAMGIEVTVAATRAASKGARGLSVVDLGGVPGLLFRRDRASVYSYSSAMGRWLRRHVAEYDLVEIHGVFNYPCLAAGYAARCSSTRYVVHPHGQLDPFDLRKHQLLKRAVGPLMIRPLVANAQRVITTSQLEAQRLVTYGGVAEVETLSLPYRVTDDGANGGAFREKYGLCDKDIVLFLGRVDYKKGLTYLIDALPEVLGSFPDVVVVLGGDDRSDYAAGLKARVRSKSLERQVHFLGTLDTAEKSSVLSTASILALVSDNENYGLVLMEGAWWSIPLVISSEVYIGGVLEEAGAALVVERSPAAVARALILLLGDDERRRRMGAQGRKLATTVFSWESVAAEQAKLRNELVARQSTAPGPPDGSA